MSRPCKNLFVGAAVSSLFACSNGPGSPSPTGTVVIQPIEVKSVVATVNTTRPASITIMVTGELGGGCDKLHAIDQQRQGSSVQVDITRSRAVPGPGEFCTLELKLFQERLGLTGTFNPGEYTVRVNTVTTTFRVE
jgi:hypothetical protein